MQKKKLNLSKDPDALALDIGICGAGIAGLATAALLVRYGHNVEIFERSQFKNEVGVALGVGSNVTHLLDAIDFDFERSKAISFERQQLFDAATLELLIDVDCSNIASKYGSPWYSMHRVNFHRELKRLALEPPASSVRAASLRLGAAVTSVDCEAGILTLADGRQVQKDVIIGADGIHSAVAKSVLGEDLPPLLDSGHSAYRFLLPAEKLHANKATAAFWEKDKAIIRMPAIADRRIISYPTDGFKSFNMALLHPTTHATVADATSWSNTGNLDDLLHTIPDFHPTVQQACAMAEDLKLWKLHYRVPLTRWSRGKVILIGDAAHPMLPHQAQAANMALEDAGAVAVLLSNVRSRHEIPSRLNVVFKIRGKRASSLQIFSNSPQDAQAKDIERVIEPYWTGGDLPKSPVEFHEYLFGYDLLKHVDEVMREEGLV